MLQEVSSFEENPFSLCCKRLLYCVVVLPWISFDKAGNYLDAGVGIVLVLLGRRILDGNQGFQAPAQSSIVQKRNKAISNVNATIQVSDNEKVRYRQTYGGIPVSHPASPHTCRRRQDHGLLVVSSNLTPTVKTLFKEKCISSCQESEKYFWSLRNWNHVLVPRWPLYPVSSRGGEFHES